MLVTWLHLNRFYFEYVMCNWREAKDEMHSLLKGWNRKMIGTHYMAYVFETLCGMMCFKIHREEGKRKYRRMAEKHLKILNVLERQGNVNCHGVARLLRAEMISFSGDMENSKRTYDEAVASFARSGFTNFSAIGKSEPNPYM